MFLIVGATALAYPLCLPDDVLNGLFNTLSATPLFREILPWISCGLSPLLLKESLLLTLVAALLFVFCWAKIRRQYLGLEQPALVGGGGSIKFWLRKPELWAFTILVYFAISIAWSPVFHQGVQTWVLMAAGVAIFIVIRSEIGRRTYAVKFMLLCVLCGAVLAGMALLQHLDNAPFLPQPIDPRNRMSSLIGHNTGLSSWLMFPLSFSLYFALTNRRLWIRLMAAAFVLLFITVIIAAQSRAIWLLGLIICVALPWKIIRLQRKRLPITAILATLTAVLAIILGLTISPQTNPLARLPVTLSDRVTGHILNLDQLRRETRLRILVVSMTELFPHNPLFGTGLGSFGWEYPKAQGQYFASHPDSRLGTTTRRTDIAHNDYLQILVETGLIGFGLLISCLFVLGKEIHLNYRRFSTTGERAIWWALMAPGAGVALQALVDFPFHVAPIAVVTVISVSIASRLSDSPIPLIDGNPSTPAPAPDRSFRKATSVGLMGTLMIFAWLPWGWQALVGRVIVSDVYYNAGVGWLDDYHGSEGQPEQKRLAMLDRAGRSFREAVINNVFNGEAYEGQATAYVNRGSFVLQALKSGQANKSDNPTTSAIAMEMSIARDAQAAIAVTDNQLYSGELRYHFTWYLLGRAWRLQWELEKDKTSPEDSKAYSEAVAALRKAIWYNPADAASLRELSDLLSASQNSADESQILQNRLFKIDPWSADELILQPALKLAAEGQIPTAHAMLDPVFSDLPNHGRVVLAKAWLAFYSAVWPPTAIDNVDRSDEYLQWRRDNLTRGWQHILRLPETSFYKPKKDRLTMLYTAAAGDIKKANRLSKTMLDSNMWDREARSIYYWTQHELYGGGLQLESTVEYYRTNALLSLYFMTDRKLGLSLGELAFRAKLTMPEIRRMTAFCVANEAWEYLRIILPPMQNEYPGDIQLQELAELTKRKL